MRNLAVTGTPYGAAAATAAPTIARSSAGLAGTAAPPPLRVTFAAGQPKLRSMWSTRPRAAHAVDGPAHHHRVGAVDLQAARVLVGPERHHPGRLGVAVDERRRHDHLVDVDEVRPEPAAQGAERRVRHAGHRRQHDRRRRHEVADPQFHGRPGYGCGPFAVRSPARSRRREAQVGVGAGVEGARAVEAQAVPAGGGDHRRVVGAHRPARQEAVQPVGGAGVEEVLAQLGVGGHAAAEGQALGADLGGGLPGLEHEDVDDGRLERRGDVGGVGVRVAADVVHRPPSSAR